MEIIDEISQLVSMAAMTSGLILMALIFAVLIGKLVSRLFED